MEKPAPSIVSDIKGVANEHSLLYIAALLVQNGLYLPPSSFLVASWGFDESIERVTSPLFKAPLLLTTGIFGKARVALRMIAAALRYDVEGTSNARVTPGWTEFENVGYLSLSLYFSEVMYLPPKQTSAGAFFQ
jgi:hypothetical protein